MKRWSCALPALLLAAALAASGCAAALGGAAGAAGYKYVSGEYDTSYHQPYDKVYEATLASLKQMDMPVKGVQRDAAGAKIEASRADGTGVSIDLAKAGPDTTNAGIRVGYMGDENASHAIANNIAQKLGEGPRQTTGQGGS